MKAALPIALARVLVLSPQESVPSRAASARFFIKDVRTPPLPVKGFSSWIPFRAFLKSKSVFSSVMSVLLLKLTMSAFC